MDEKYHHPFKTMGKRWAHLITELNERACPTFTVADIADITGLSRAASRSLAHQGCRRGLATRLKPGLYNLVPFQMGRARRFVCDPRLIARDMAGPHKHYLSHGTAFDMHGMLGQPCMVVHLSCVKRFRPQQVGGHSFKFWHLRDEQVFGTTRHFIDGDQTVEVSDLERTVIDGLRHPAALGGITEVAKGIWYRHDALDLDRLVGYAVRLGVGAVMRRAGYLLELYELAGASTLAPLRERLTSTYHRLDTIEPGEGRRLARWRLQLNVSADELSAVRHG